MENNTGGRYVNDRDDSIVTNPLIMEPGHFPEIPEVPAEKEETQTTILKNNNTMSIDHGNGGPNQGQNAHRKNASTIIEANEEEQNNSTIFLERIKVENPKETLQGSTSYTIQGYDKLGMFSNVEKRYNDFFLLHEYLTFRYQGLYVPEIPPKKSFGKKEPKFIEERR